MTPNTTSCTEAPDAGFTLRETWAAGLLGIALTGAWTLAVGQDVSADLLNHHVYLPYSLLTGRHVADLFAAGPQSYQNPIGYVPFYWMLQAGWAAWAIGLVLAAVHGLMLAPMAAIAQTVLGRAPDSRWWRWLSLALAWASPVFLLYAGTTSLDPISHLLVLVALACVLAPGPGWRRSLAGGLALGLAFAIKPTSAVFALAIGAVLIWRLYLHQTLWRQSLAFVGSSLVSAAAAMGFWTHWLWSTFGNPMFPLFNQHFQSPFAPTQPIVALRFLPQSLHEWFSRPFEMAALQTFTSTESFVPDFRPGALIGFGLLAGSLAVARARPGAWRGPVGQLVIFAVVSYIFWMQTSGNSRYAMPLLAIIAVLLVAAVKSAIPASLGRMVLGTLLVVHCANYWAVGEHRLVAQAWRNGPYLDVKLPARLKEEPFLHLSIGTQSRAMLAPWLHQDGRFINVVGQLSLPTHGPLGDQLATRLSQWQGKTRYLLDYEGSWIDVDESSSARRLRAELAVEHLPLHIDWSDCLPMLISPSPRGEARNTQILSCGAIPGLQPSGTRVEARVRAGKVFEAIERRCPLVYGPSPFVSYAGRRVWLRQYANSDVQVLIDAQDEVFVGHFRSMKVVLLGKVTDILSGKGLDPCEAWKKLRTT